MPYFGNIATSAILDIKFTTIGVSGSPQTLAGSPAISVYKSNSTTETTTGITLTVDFDSRTGLNHVRIDTSADGTFYAAGNEFDVVITAGTVDSISAVGVVVGHFSIQNRYQDKTGYALTQSFPSNFASLAITVGGAVTAGTVSDKTGYSLTQTFPTNFSSLAITGGGAVTAGTVSDKTGYSLTQSFPTNFATLAIDGSGLVTAGTVADKTGYSLAQAFPTNFSSLVITVDGKVTAGTVSDKIGYTVSTVSDKTGYSLVQSFPSNFATLAIDGSGRITAGTVVDKTGYSLTQTFPTNFGLLSIDSSGYVTSTGGGGGGATADEVAAAILSNPSNKLSTDASGQVTVANKTGYSLTQQFPTNFSTMLIGTDGKVTTTGTSGPTTDQIAAAILTTPANKIQTDAQGLVSLTGASQTTIQQNILNAPVGTQAEGTLGRKVGSLSDAQVEETTVSYQGSPVSSTGDLTIVQGDDYFAQDGDVSTIQWSSSSWPDLSKARIVMKIYDDSQDYLEVDMIRRDNNSVYVELNATQTRQLTVGQFNLSVYAVFSQARRRSLIRGKATILKG